MAEATAFCAIRAISFALETGIQEAFFKLMCNESSADAQTRFIKYSYIRCILCLFDMGVN